MLLYHYTSHEHHWSKILEDGYLRTTDAVLDGLNAKRQDVRVVWLTSEYNPVQQWQGKEGEVSFYLPDGAPVYVGADKSEVRMTIDVSLGPGGAQHYPKFAKRYKVPRTTVKGLAATGGDPQTWYVVPRRIFMKEWVKVELTKDGTVLWEPVPA